MTPGLKGLKRLLTLAMSINIVPFIKYEVDLLISSELNMLLSFHQVTTQLTPLMSAGSAFQMSQVTVKAGGQDVTRWPRNTPAGSETEGRGGEGRGNRFRRQAELVELFA